MSYCTIHVFQKYDNKMSDMHITPTKNATNAHKNMTTSSQKTSSHIPRSLPRQQKYDSCQSYNMSSENMTTHSYMPRRIGIFSAQAGQRRARTPSQSRHAPRVVGIVNFVIFYAQTIIYIHMTDVRSDSSLITRVSHRACHSPPVHHQSYFGIL
jgi:hypothetical protein